MRIRNLSFKLPGLITVIATMVVASVGVLTPISQASAAPPEVHVCLYSNDSECIVTEGQGQPVKTNSGGWATFALAEVGNTIWYTLTDANGHCLRETSSNAVEIGNGSCSSSDQAAQWDWFTSGNPSTEKFRNRGQDNGNDYLGTYGTDNNRPVWAYPQATGFYTGWILREVQ